MQKVFFVKNNELDEVNEILAKGGEIVSIRPVAESVCGERSKSVGDIYAYVVVDEVGGVLERPNQHNYSTQTRE